MVETLEAGQVLEVLGTDPLTLKDPPRISENSDHELTKVDEEAGICKLFYLGATKSGSVLVI